MCLPAPGESPVDPQANLSTAKAGVRPIPSRRFGQSEGFDLKSMWAALVTSLA